MGGRPAKTRAKQRQPSKSEALLARVVEAGGTLEVSHGDGVNYWSLMATANLYKVPKGKRLAWVGRHGKNALRPRIRLEDLPAWVNAVLEPVVIPATLTDQHSVVAALARGEERFDDIAEGRRPGALRLVQGIVTEAEQRGHIVTLGAVEQAYRRRTASQQWIHLTVTVCGYHIYIGISHDWPNVGSSDAQRRSFGRAPGPVRLQIINGFEHHGSSWWLEVDDDRVGSTLAQVMHELELRAAAEEEHRLRRLEEDRQRRLRWEEATAPARAAYMEDHRAKALIKQVRQWRLTQSIDAYLEALEEVNAENGDDSDVAEWIAWARGYRERIDPLNRLEIPVDHVPDAETLNRFLPKGFDPHSILWKQDPYD